MFISGATISAVRHIFAYLKLKYLQYNIRTDQDSRIKINFYLYSSWNHCKVHLKQANSGSTCVFEISEIKLRREEKRVTSAVNYLLYSGSLWHCSTALSRSTKIFTYPSGVWNLNKCPKCSKLKKKDLCPFHAVRLRHVCINIKYFQEYDYWPAGFPRKPGNGRTCQSSRQNMNGM